MAQNKPLRFSIVIPAYNEARYIADTLDSIKKQDFKGSYEVIVVDNNSLDDTVIIAKSLAVRVMQELSPGVCWARQKGTKRARGEIVISTDADTVFNSNWLSDIDNVFQKNEGCVAVAGPCKYMNGPIWGTIYAKILFGSINAIYSLTGQVIYITATNIAFRKNAWQGYNTELTQGGDELDLLRNLRKQGKVVFNIHNTVHTSARRLARGFLYNFFVTFLTYYILEYNLNRLSGRRILGSAPAFRNEFSPKVLALIQVCLTAIVITLFTLYTRPGHYLWHQSRNIVKITRSSVLVAH